MKTSVLKSKMVTIPVFCKVDVELFTRCLFFIEKCVFSFLKKRLTSG